MTTFGRGLTNRQIKVLEKSNKRCAYCGAPLRVYWGYSGPREFTLDHVLALKYDYEGFLWGNNCLDNLFACCLKCNMLKWNKPLAYLRKNIFSRCGSNLFYIEELNDGHLPIETLRYLEGKFLFSQRKLRKVLGESVDKYNMYAVENEMRKFGAIRDCVDLVWNEETEDINYIARC